MRSLADQTVQELGGALSVLTRQKHDHEELDKLLHELGRTDPQQQGPALRRIYRLVFPHAFAEESVLWPVFRRVLPDGPELTLRIEQEHQELNELVTRLESLAADDPERARVLTRLQTTLDEDVRDEEEVLLPRVQQQLAVMQLRLLGTAWELVRRIAPTRCHPMVSRRPPGNALAALPLSVIDRLRDRVDTAIERSRGRGHELLVTAGEKLTDVAHRVEHVGIFRRGEDFSTSRP